MLYYLRVYKKILQLNLAALTAYRWNFINSTLSSISWGIFSIASIMLVTNHTAKIFEWSREEILLLTGIYGIVLGIFHFFFSSNFDRLSQIIHRGELDIFLVKPIDTQFLLSTSRVGYTSIFRILMNIGFTVYLLNQLAIKLSLFQIASFCFLLVIGILLLYSIWFIISTLIIWFTRLSNLVDLMYTLSNIARYPNEMYQQLVWYVFLFLLPITLVVSTPTKVLLQKALAGDVVLLLLFSVTFFLISRKFWKFALRYYTSASS